jgi:hypothetical protein
MPRKEGAGMGFFSNGRAFICQMAVASVTIDFKWTALDELL